MLLYASISVLRWVHFDLDSYDLPIYHQIVWHLSRFDAPAVTVLGEANYFGDHFSPILALFAPLYWVSTSPAVLLVGQAVLIASAIPAVYLYARRRVSQRAAIVLCIAFAQSWGVWAAIDSAVHEVAFAVPLVAWGICFADRGRWLPAYACLGALVFVKEDMGLVVAAIGVLIALRGERRRGAVIAVAGVLLLIVVNELVLPAFGSGDWSVRDALLYGQYGDSATGAALHLATHPGELVSALVDDSQKLRLIALLLAAFACLPLLSPVSLVAVPLVLERLLANDPHLWSPSYQYSAVPMVILALAAADGAAVVAGWLRGRRFVAELLVGCAGALSVVSAAAFPLGRLAHRAYWHSSPADDAARAAARSVPDHGSVASDWSMLAHLAPREEMYLPGQIRRRRPRYVVLRSGDLKRSGYHVVRSFGAVRVLASETS